VVTPRAGAHYFFNHPGEEIRNSAGMLGVGLDVRGDGGFVVVPPSEGANGRRYEPDDRAPLANPPDWLLQRITRPADARRAVPASEWLSLVTGGLVAGGRNAGLTRLTGHLLCRDVDPRLVRELILLLARHRCKPPLSDHEAIRIVESIAGRELARRTAA
jgi:putative DNA primase/helicase